MDASIVICAYTMDRWKALAAAVTSCCQQTLPPREIIVVIDYNVELLTRAKLELTGVRVIANQMAKGLSGARNTGIVFSTGEVIAFLDDDAVAEPNWLEELLAPLADLKIAGTGGWILPLWEAGNAAWFPTTFYWILGCSYLGLLTATASIRNPIGASMAIRRSVFTSVGGFTSGIGRIGSTPLGCEETELCIRYSLVSPHEHFELAPKAIVQHRVPASRLTWHYFWTRCWAEGLSKAAVSSLVGSNSALASERKHLVNSLPIEFVRTAKSIPSQPRTALIRMSLILAGTAITAAGFLRGRLTLRRSPLKMGKAEQELVVRAPSDDTDLNPF